MSATSAQQLSINATESKDPGLSHDDFVINLGLRPTPEIQVQIQGAILPAEYRAACAAIAACSTINEGKYWSDKADALAAWGAIYKDDEVGRQARILKLYAFRRIGELARILRPQTAQKGFGKGPS